MTDSALTVDQLRRAEALDRARDVLSSRGFASQSGADSIDLVSVARWIITGDGPWVDEAVPGDD